MTHIYDPVVGPFQNLCSLSRPDAEKVVDRMKTAGRPLKANYLDRRIATEDWLLAERVKMCGRPRLSNPLYFFLGNFADGKDPWRPNSLVLPLAHFPPETLTFTYPDSMASHAIAAFDKNIVYRKAYHGRLFSLPDLEKVVGKFGLPGERWKTDESMRYDRFVEVQLWDDRSLPNIV